MPDQPQLTGWRKAAAIGNVAIAVMAVLGGIASAYVVIVDHFAKQSDMESVLCFEKERAQLIELQIEAGNLYTRYVNAKLELLRLGEETEENRDNVSKTTTRREIFWARLLVIQRKAITLAKEIKNGKCPQFETKSAS